MLTADLIWFVFHISKQANANAHERTLVNMQPSLTEGLQEKSVPRLKACVQQAAEI